MVLTIATPYALKIFCKNHAELTHLVDGLNAIRKARETTDWLSCSKTSRTGYTEYGVIPKEKLVCETSRVQLMELGMLEDTKQKFAFYGCPINYVEFEAQNTVTADSANDPHDLAPVSEPENNEKNKQGDVKKEEKNAASKNHDVKNTKIIEDDNGQIDAAADKNTDKDDKADAVKEGSGKEK